MGARAGRVEHAEILGLRGLYLQEMNAQVRYDACHVRGWADTYRLELGDRTVGYGAVKGLDDLGDRDAIFEWYVVPAFRNRLDDLFVALLEASGASYIECQTNDALLSGMMYVHAENVRAHVVLFADHEVTRLPSGDVSFRRRRDGDAVTADEGEWLLERDGEVLATGGFLLHYNPPFADLYMAVPEPHRRQGFGSLILQELKRECYLAGRVPAARCNLSNRASRATLLRAGMRVSGFMLAGDVRSP